ncbi:MAG: hypothetical protein V2A74_09010, partial [bacterium]
MRASLRLLTCASLLLLTTSCSRATYSHWFGGPKKQPYLVTTEQMANGAHHTHHAELFGADAPGVNIHVLQGVDVVQAHAMDGGGYFIGIKAVPTESPVGYPLTLLDTQLLDPPRPTSYCSGSSYAAFIEGLNLLYGGGHPEFSPERREAMRQQE